jgi:hypothetical protein
VALFPSSILRTSTCNIPNVHYRYGVAWVFLCTLYITFSIFSVFGNNRGYLVYIANASKNALPMRVAYDVTHVFWGRRRERDARVKWKCLCTLSIVANDRLGVVVGKIETGRVVVWTVAIPI